VRGRFASAILTVATALLGGTPAQAREVVTFAGGVGPTGRDIGGKWHAAVAPELTLHVPFISLSTGASVSSDGLDYAYGEFCIHPIVSLGAGLGYGAYTAATGRRDGLGGHVIVGLPIPLVQSLAELTDEERVVPYLLPFYRPAWGPWSGTAHELGVMLKFGAMPHELRYHGKGR
jgi:hypothetical protein